MGIQTVRGIDRAREPAGRPSALPLVAAFAAIYLLWGANFLAIRYAVEALPPFLTMAARSALAGAMLFAWGLARDGIWPEPRHWRAALTVGALLFLGCHGLLAWGEQHVPSGLAALLLATIPMWMSLLDWLAAGGRSPGARVWTGMVLGLLGVAALLAPEPLRGHGVGLGSGLVLLLSALCWAAGSIAARRLPLPASLVTSTGMQLLAGGALLALVAGAAGEPSRLTLAALAPKPLAALGYMVVCASLLGFTAYAWLLRVSTPARVGSYAFVNPLVAVLLGWAVGGEPLGLRTLVACGLVVAGVALIVTAPAEA